MIRERLGKLFVIMMILKYLLRIRTVYYCSIEFLTDHCSVSKANYMGLFKQTRFLLMFDTQLINNYIAIYDDEISIILYKNITSNKIEKPSFLASHVFEIFDLKSRPRNG